MTFPNQYGGGYTGPGAPPPPPEGGIKLSEHVGDLLWAKFLGFEAQRETKFGTRDAIYLDIEVIEGRSGVGQLVSNALLTNGMLVGQLRNSATGTEMFVRVAAKQGANASPAIYFESPRSGDENAVNAFLARRAGQAPAPQVAPQAQPQGQQAPAYGQPQNAPQGLPPATPPPAQSYQAPAGYDAPPF
jgi:hypothetical protein